MSSQHKQATILVVDDTPENIDVLVGILEADYQLKVALNGVKALEMASSEPIPDLILLDIMMPEMDGYEVIRQLKAVDESRNIPVIFVTAKGEMADEARGFRLGAVDYITKPVQPLRLTARVKAHIQLKQAREKVENVLDTTLTGLLSLLTDLLSLSNPFAFSRAARLKRYMEIMQKKMGIGDNWQFSSAALLSQIGCITLEEKSLRRLYNGQQVSKKELQSFQRHPAVGYKFLRKIPYLGTVAEIISQQHKPLEKMSPGSSGVRINGVDEVSLGATLLKIASDIDKLTAHGKPLAEAFKSAAGEIQCLDPGLADSLGQIAADSTNQQGVAVKDLSIGMILEKDLYTQQAVLIINAGTELTMPILERILAFHENVGIKEPVSVILPEQGD